MTRLRLILPLFMAFGLTAQKIEVEFDQTRDFSAYRTFRIADGKIHSRNPALNNSLVEKQIETELRQRLLAKGLTETSSAPDINVRFSLGSGQRTEVDRYPAGWYGTRVVRRRYTEGTLIVDLRDAKAHELVWRGIALEEKNSAIAIKEHLGDMVRKALDKYPPKKK